jgi:hypothetical protein
MTSSDASNGRGVSPGAQLFILGFVFGALTTVFFVWLYR